MADSQVQSTKIQLDKLIVRALADGEILQVNVRPGSSPLALWNQALVVIGDSKRLHVRVDIDENDVPLFNPQGEGGGHAQGATRRHSSRTSTVFKVEPYIIPKKSLTGDNTERVDTRVLQVVYVLPENCNDLSSTSASRWTPTSRPTERRRTLALDTDLRRTSPFEDKKADPAPAKVANPPVH